METFHLTPNPNSINNKTPKSQNLKFKMDTNLIFFKCTRWQLEETLDKFSCPFHYYCDSIYPGDYPAVVDSLVLLFTVTTYLSTLFFMLADMLSRGPIGNFDPRKRFLLPSSPISLPIFLFVLTKGHQINTLFPLFLIGPSILHLVYISALTFENKSLNDIKFVFFEASTMSGILHASLNLDSLILPYYTGLDALNGSKFSGECLSCVCRNNPLVVGGRFVSYRGWSRTTFVVVCTLLTRIVCRISTDKLLRKALVLRWLLEGLAFVLIMLDCVYLSLNLALEKRVLQGFGQACVFVLIFVHLVKVVMRWKFLCFVENDQLVKV